MFSVLPHWRKDVGGGAGKQGSEDKGTCQRQTRVAEEGMYFMMYIGLR